MALQFVAPVAFTLLAGTGPAGAAYTETQDPVSEAISARVIFNGTEGSVYSNTSIGAEGLLLGSEGALASVGFGNWSGSSMSGTAVLYPGDVALGPAGVPQDLYAPAGSTLVRYNSTGGVVWTAPAGPGLQVHIQSLDFDGDSILDDAAVANDQRRVVTYLETGMPAGNANIGGTNGINALGAVDIASNGSMGALVLAHQNGRVYLFDSALNQIWRYDTPNANPVVRLGVADIDSDGFLEFVVAATDAGEVYVVSGLTNPPSLAWSHLASANPVALAGFDPSGSGRLSGILVATAGWVTALNSTGGVAWNYTVANSTATRATPVDLDGDGALEGAAIGLSNGTILFLGAGGSPVGWVPTFGSPVVALARADLNQDGIQGEIVAANATSVSAVSNGSPVLWRRSYSATINTIRSADLEGWGYLSSTMVATATGISILNRTGAEPWNASGGSAVMDVERAGIPSFLSSGTLVTAPIDAVSAATWGALNITSAVPNGTQLTWEARFGSGTPGNITWGNWSAPQNTSGANLTVAGARFLQLRFNLSSTVANSSPRLQGLRVDYSIPAVTGSATTAGISPAGAHQFLTVEAQFNLTGGGAVRFFYSTDSGFSWRQFAPPAPVDAPNATAASIMFRVELDSGGGSPTVSWVAVSYVHSVRIPAFMWPPANSTLAGTVNLTSTAPPGVTSLDFAYIDPSNNTTTIVGPATYGPSNLTWVLPWNTSGLDMANLTLLAIGHDARGFLFTGRIVPVTIDNTPPSVSIVAPSAGRALTGTTTLLATASADTVAVSFVYGRQGLTLPIGNATFASGQWSFVWNTTLLATIEDGILEAVAVDRAGLVGRTNITGVTVDNEAPWVTIDYPVPPTVIAGQPRVYLNASLDATSVSVFLNGLYVANATRVGVGATSSLWRLSALNTSSTTYNESVYISAVVLDRVGLSGAATSGPFTVDNTLPTANLLSPAPEGVYTGVVHLVASAPPQVTRVEFFYQRATDTSPTLIRDMSDGERNPSTGYFEFDWDTRSPVKIDFNGSIVLRAHSNLNQSGLLPFKITIDNTAPFVQFLAPAIGETRVVGDYTVRAQTAADAVAVTFSYINQTTGLRTVVGNLTRASGSSWEFVWNTSGIYIPSVTLRLDTFDLVGFTGWEERTDMVIGSGVGDMPPRIVGALLDVALREDWGVYELPISSLVVDEDPANVTVFVEGADPANITIRNNGARGLLPLYFISVKDKNTGGARVPLTLRVVDRFGQTATQGQWGYLITPVNDPPEFRDAPSRILVHYDSVYEFDFSSYIYDVENRTAGMWQPLTLTASDTAHVSPGGGLKLRFEYPQSMLGQSVNVTLSVTDGQSESPPATARLEVVVTDDWMPKATRPLPTITLLEDVPKSNLFNLNDYFVDPDNDPIFYYRGTTNITFRIDPDGNVSVTALPLNWHGTQDVFLGARDPKGAFSEAKVVVIVEPVNDPPEWDLPTNLDFHNVSVRFDVDYVINYDSFVFDVDSPLVNLAVTTDDPAHAFTAPGLPRTLILRYNESLNGTTWPLRVWITDGLANSTVLTLNVTISDNYPPAIIEPLPRELVINEGERRENVMNLLNYFHDRDGVLFFAFGAKYVSVSISNSTGWVTIASLTDWSGTERVVLRAIDNRGAFQDSVLLLTVLPVDDPPRLAAFPEYTFFAGEYNEIPLMPFASDIDSDPSTFRFTVSSIYPNASVAIIAGTLQLIYPEYDDAPPFDALKVCVSDGGPVPTCRTVAVKVVHRVETPFDWFQFFFFLGTVAAASVVAARRFFEFKVRRPPTVEDVFLVYEDGILIKHYSKQVRKFADDDVVTSMLSAIQSFASDSFEDTANWELREIAFQGRKILIERARKFQIFVIFDGDSNEDLKKAVRKAAESIADSYEEPLRDWDGDPSHFDGAEVHFARLLAMQQAFVPKGVTADELRRAPLLPGGVFVSETGDFGPIIEEYSDELKGTAVVRLRPQGDAGVSVDGLESEEMLLVEIPPPSGVPADDEAPQNGLDIAVSALADAVEEATVAVRHRFPVVLFEGFDFVVDRYGFVFSKKFADQLKRMAASEGFILCVALSPAALSPNQIEAVERDAVVVRQRT